MVSSFIAFARTLARGYKFDSPAGRAVRVGFSLALLAMVVPVLAACGFDNSGKAARGWQDYPNVDGNFTVSFPQAPSVSSQEAMGMSVHMYIVDLGSKAYMVTYTDLPDQYVQGNPDPGLEGAVSGSLSSVGATLETKTDISISGYPGKDVTARSSQGYLHVHYLFAGSRLYSILAASPNQGDADSERFVNSFRLGVYKTVNTATTVPYYRVVTATPMNTATPQPTVNPKDYTRTPTPVPLPPTATATPEPRDTGGDTLDNSNGTDAASNSGTLNDMLITIVGSREDASEEGGAFGPAQGDTILMLQVRVENMGNFSIDFDKDLCTLEGPGGRQYLSRDYWHAKDAPRGPIAAGGSSSGEIAFEVPANAPDLTFVYKPVLGPRGLSLRLQIPR